MSLYMGNPLRSKDLDFVSAQVGSRQMEALADLLSKAENVESRATTVQTRRFNGKRMRTYAIELRVNHKPFFVELFDRVLEGESLSLLQPHVELRKRWGLEIWVPSREAIVAVRLAFRQPEGVSRLNALRLNSFIQETRSSLDFVALRSILREWRVENRIEQNLIQLYKLNRVRIVDDRKILPGIDEKLTTRVSGQRSASP